MQAQLTLPIQLNDDAQFQNFYCSALNRVAFNVLNSFVESPSDNVYLYGSVGGGVSHLLQACCSGLIQKGLRVQYLPLKQLIDYYPQDVLSGLETLDVVCLDDIDLIAGKPDWEEAVFHLYNQLQHADVKILFGAHQSSQNIAICLADLKSRLQWGMNVCLFEAGDEDLVQILSLRAQSRGLNISEEVAQYLQVRLQRDIQSLMDVLDKLDRSSLQSQRRITIPFVKDVLGI